MTGILVRNAGGVPVQKHVFAGDVSVVAATVVALQAKNPTFTFETHNDSDPDWATSFEQVVVAPPAKVVDPGWAAAKSAGPASALTFLAQKLGLE